MATRLLQLKAEPWPSSKRFWSSSSRWTVRVAWIVLAAAVPLAIGITVVKRQPAAADRESAAPRILRGFPITALPRPSSSVFVTVPALRVVSIMPRRIDVQVPLLTDAAFRAYVPATPPAGRTASLGDWRTSRTRLGGCPFRMTNGRSSIGRPLQLGRALEGQRQLLEATPSEVAGRVVGLGKERPMATLHNGDSARTLSNRALIGEIAAKAMQLAKKELELARAEIGAEVKSELAMAKALGVSLVAALTGMNLLLVTGVFALATIIPGWLAGLIVGGSVLVIAGGMGYLGWRRHVKSPLALTRQTLKEDVQWVKARVA